MSTSFKTKQEEFWAGEFGDEYITRNTGFINSKINLFHEALPSVGSVYEVGANIGLNLDAVHEMDDSTELYALEINNQACEALSQKPHIKFTQGSLLENPPYKAQLVLSSGVLIHIDPDRLPQAYEHIYNASDQYILLCEYYNPSPVEVVYRGHEGKLFKRDFAGEMMDKYNLKLLKYGFVYHRDPLPLDDITWFLLEK